MPRARSAETRRALCAGLAAEVLADAGKFLGVVYPDWRFHRFHLRWFGLQREHRETLVLAPRGHGKTTVCTCAYAAWRLLSDRDRRVLLVSRTADQAQTIASEIRGLLTSSPAVAICFGALRDEPWSAGAFTVRGRSRARREPSVTALGIGGPITSKHFDLILCDDVLDFENSRTRVEREHVAAWVGTVLEPTLDPGGEIHWVGTRQHPEDYYARLLDRAYYANLAVNDPETRGAIVERGEVRQALWKARFTLDAAEAVATGKIDLSSERRKKGAAIFDAQYMNDVGAMTGKVFRPDWIVRYRGIDQRAEPPRVIGPDGVAVPIRRVVQGVDPAISLAGGADYFAHVTLAVVPGEGNEPAYAVLATFRDRLTFDEQVLLILAQAAAYRPSAIGIEDVAYQKALVQEVRKRARASGGSLLPVKGVPRRTDKVARAFEIQGMVEDRRLWFAPAERDLVDELLGFPDGPHDDLVDALETAITLARTVHRPAQW